MTDPEVLIIDELSLGLAPVFVYQPFFEAIPRHRYRLSRLARERGRRPSVAEAGRFATPTSSTPRLGSRFAVGTRTPLSD